MKKSTAKVQNTDLDLETESLASGDLHSSDQVTTDSAPGLQSEFHDALTSPHTHNSKLQTQNSKLQTPNSKLQPSIVTRAAVAVRSADPGQRRAAGNIFKFLAFLLALTLIARGSSAATLARVQISEPTRSSIVDEVTGNAVVSTIETLEITAPGGLTIAEMVAVVGQTVSTGDAITIFDIEEVGEKLTRETLSLDRMLLDLERLVSAETTDRSSVNSAWRSLLRAREDLEAVIAQGEADIAAAQEALLDALDDSGIESPDASSLQSALRSLERAREDYAIAEAQGEADILAALEALEEAQNNPPADVDHSQVETARRSLERAREDYITTRAQGNAEVSDAYDALDALDPFLASDREINQAWAAIGSAQRRAEDNLISANRRIEDAEAALERAEQDYARGLQQAADARQSDIDRAQDALDNARSRAADNLFSAARRLEDAESAYERAELDYGRNEQQTLDSFQSAIDRAVEALENAQIRAEENLLSAQRRVEDAEAAMRTAEQNYANSQRQISENSVLNELSASTLRLDIEAQKTIVDALEELMANDCVLHSSIEGVVASVMAEGSVTSTAPVVTFRDGAKGYEAQMQLSGSDAYKLAVGDECEVTTGGGSLYFTPTVTAAASLFSLPDSNDNVTVTIRLPGGDWTHGQRVEVRFVVSSGNYDLCVPISALHSDNSGYYLYAVDKQSTVLGAQNVVFRIDVNLVASDSHMASVRGPVGRDSQIVTGSSKPIASGDRVRIGS